MKKIIALTMVAASLAATSSFSQGFFAFQAGKSQVYDGFTSGTAALSANVNVAFLWAAASTTPNVDSFVTSSAKLGNSTTTANYTVAQAWTDILNGQFTLALNSSGSTPVIATSAANGSVTYNGGASFGINGTSPSTVYTIYMVSYPSSYGASASALTSAQSAGAAVGWSAPFQYTAVANNGTPGGIAGLAASFGTFVPAPIPEPATMALAAIGGASLLLFRRRK